MTLTNEAYQRVERLSASGINLMLKAPAIYRWQMDHRDQQPTSDAFDIGSAFHAIALGDDTVQLVEVPADDWRKQAARDLRDQARAVGDVPLLTKDLERVTAMVDALRAHPVASVLINPKAGKVEHSVMWEQQATGVPMKARFDLLPDKVPGQPYIVPDLKSAFVAEPRAWVKKAGDYAYHIQAAMYLDAVKTLGIDQNPRFVFVNVEKTPPYLVSVVEFDPDDLALARDQIDHVARVWAECTKTGIWPGYPPGITTVQLPVWYYSQAVDAALDEIVI